MQGREVASWKKDPPGPARFDSTNATSTPSPASRPAQPGNSVTKLQSFIHKLLVIDQPSQLTVIHRVIVIDQPSQVTASHKAVFRIRIGFNAVPDPAFTSMRIQIRIRIQGAKPM
jgi:hypothetical protein